MVQITNDYELEQYCDRHQECDCRCMQCPAFASLQRNELGIKEDEEDESDKE